MKKLWGRIKLWLIRRLMRNMCSLRHCDQCKAYLGYNGKLHRYCAQYYILDQAEDVWGESKES